MIYLQAHFPTVPRYGGGPPDEFTQSVRQRQKRGGAGSDLWSDPTQDKDKLVLVRKKG